MSTIVIIGAGIVGTATALHVAEADPGLDVVLIEADPTYTWAATGRGNGGVRQLFTRPENILLSQYTLDVVENWQEWASLDGQPVPDLDWRRNGYLFVAEQDDLIHLQDDYITQQSCGVAVEWLEPAALATRFPEIRVDDLVGAVLSTRDGWLDPKAFFAGLQVKARQRGVREVHDRVEEILLGKGSVRGVRLAEGGSLLADAVFNCAGVRAPQLAKQIEMRLPVEPMRRHGHYVTAETTADHLPFIKDAKGLAIHPHEDGFSVGLVDFNHPGGEDFSIDATYFDRTVSPAMAHRLSGLSGFVEQRTWTGLYDQNRLDGNAIIGNWPGHYDNFYVASGFSGHGLMQALGVGRALAEHLLTGSYQTIDLARLGYARVENDQPYPELGVR
jgi:FAD-dependent oxidoreductase domain-containing protein 1